MGRSKVIRETSIEAYNEIKENGLLSKRRFQVYETLYNNGPLTTGEIWYIYFRDQGISQNSINPRLSELVSLGVVSEVGKRSCKITGRNVLVPMRS